MKITKLNEDDARIAYYGIRERLFFNQLSQHMNYNVQYVSDETGHDSWDVIYQEQDGTRNMGEIKIRKKFSDYFNGEKWILEYRKWSEILRLADGIEAKKTHLQGKFILCLFDKVLIWNLRNVKEEDFFIDELRATSVNGSLTVRDKKVAHISKKNAIEIDFKMDYDQLDTDAKFLFNYRYPTSKLILNDYIEY